MQIVDTNVAIVATATAAFLAAYHLNSNLAAQNLSEAFVDFATKWYTDNGMSIDLKREVLCEGAIVYATNEIAKAREVYDAVQAMMSFKK